MAEPKLPPIDLTYRPDFGTERIEGIYTQAQELGADALPGGKYSATGSPEWTKMYGGEGGEGYIDRMAGYAEKAPWLQAGMNEIIGLGRGAMERRRGDIRRTMGTRQEGTGGAEAWEQQLAEAQGMRGISRDLLDYTQRMHRERMYGMGAVGQQYLAGLGLGTVPAGQAYGGMQNVYANAPGILTPWQQQQLQGGQGGGGGGVNNPGLFFPQPAAGGGGGGGGELAPGATMPNPPLPPETDEQRWERMRREAQERAARGEVNPLDWAGGSHGAGVGEYTYG
jgi:hypothetical protein